MRGEERVIFLSSRISISYKIYAATLVRAVCERDCNRITLFMNGKRRLHEYIYDRADI